MGTVVEHRLFTLGDNIEIEGNPRRNSVEIIDVDAHDDGDVQASSSSSSSQVPRPGFLQRHSFQGHETISLLDDSDDEIQILSDTMRDNNNNRQATSSRHRLRSPPPFSIVDVVPPPPVPPIPRRFSSFTSLPMGRRLPPSFSPVRTNPQGFAFEPTLNERQSMAGPSHHFPFRIGDVQMAAPPSHHTPLMGLGGALLSSNNVRAQQEAAHAARSAAHTRLVPASRRRWLAAANLDELLLHDPIQSAGPDIRRWRLFESHQPEHFVRLFQHRLRGREEPSPQAKYQPGFTHPGEPEAGFTFDFASNSSSFEDSPSERRPFPPTSVNAPIVIDDDDDEGIPTGPSSKPSSKLSMSPEPGKWTTLLVCARCLEPLLVNESLGPDENGRRIWALRCGHMIDENCLNEIGQPDNDVEPEADNDNPSPVPDRKSKGKAKARQRPTYGEAAIAAAPINVNSSNSIRSRLRSAASAAVAAVSASSSSPSPSTPPPTKRRRNAIVRPTIEAEFDWKCPVASCGLVHVSLKVDGQWGPEKEGKPLVGGLPAASASHGPRSSSSSSSSDSVPRAKARGAIPVFA